MVSENEVKGDGGKEKGGGGGCSKAVEKKAREKKKSVWEIDEGWLKVQDDVVNIWCWWIHVHSSGTNWIEAQQ